VKELNKITNTFLKKFRKNIQQPVVGRTVGASSFGLFFSNNDPVRIDFDSASVFNLNAPND